MSSVDPPARFKDLCIDAADAGVIGTFWATVLARRWESSEDVGAGKITGVEPGDTIWINAVPEPQQVKQRVHLDVYARSIDDLVALGSRVDLPAGDGRRWTVMQDPEGGQYCAFLRDEPPAERLHGLVVDSADPAAIATWWAQALGGELTHHESGYSTVSEIPGMPIETFDFVPVPEPKTVKNRIHWDVTSDWRALRHVGATMLRPRDSVIGWNVMQDPEGNEFCVFA